ncbi:MAG: TIGR03905 family TSCPD domain-containing protein [Bacilli bacterium]|nr:TIGR03905 family TSCPD domain-containing protein [Bacilli bacterium]
MEVVNLKPLGVCSREIQLAHENGKIVSVKFFGGCPGNLEGIARLLEGLPFEKVIEKFEGIKCRGSRTGETSCPDQLAQLLKTIK